MTTKKKRPSHLLITPPPDVRVALEALATARAKPMATVIYELITEERARVDVPTVTDQSRNGVRVIVKRWATGSTVDASCACLGHAGRAHSDERCPNLRAQVAARKPVSA